MESEATRKRLSEPTSWGATLWLWWRFSVRRVLRNPLRVSIVLVSVALATTLASAVLKVSIASINSFERGIAGGERPYNVLVSPTGGRIERDVIAPCLRAIAPHADVLGVRREAAVLAFAGHEIPVRVSGVASFAS